jgi:hypothetical protein
VIAETRNRRLEKEERRLPTLTGFEFDCVVVLFMSDGALLIRPT